MHRNEYLEPAYGLSPVGFTPANSSPAGQTKQTHTKPHCTDNQLAQVQPNQRRNHSACAQQPTKTRTTEGRQNWSLKPVNTRARPITCGPVGARTGTAHAPVYPAGPQHGTSPVRPTPDKNTKRCRQTRPTEHPRWANNLRINLTETPLTCKTIPLVYRLYPSSRSHPKQKHQALSPSETYRTPALGQ